MGLPLGPGAFYVTINLGIVGCYLGGKCSTNAAEAAYAAAATSNTDAGVAGKGRSAHQKDYRKQ